VWLEAGRDGKRCTGSCADATAGQADKRGRLVGDRHPEIEAVTRRQIRAGLAQGGGDQRATAGVLVACPLDRRDPLGISQQVE
jgi:hypothetical protein